MIKIIHVYTIGADKFYADADRMRLEMPHLIMHSIDDISANIQGNAEILAPLGETGVLKTFGVGREEAKPEIGFAEGYSQDWQTGVENLVPQGDKTYRGIVGLRKSVPYSLFVHEGTGLWGPLHSLIVKEQGNFKFMIDGKWKSVRVLRGQKPQPFLKDAYEISRLSYVPIRVKYLGEQIVHPGIG